MVNIAIEYPCLFLKRTATGTVPTSWDELTEKQLVEISRNVNGREIDFHFLSVLTSISVRFLKKLSPFQLLKLSREINFIGNASTYHSKFIIRRLKGTKLYAPKPKLAGMTFVQFIFADSYYNDWLAAQDETALNNFVATLYLCPGEKFDNEIIPIRVSTIVNVDIDVRKSIAINYGLILMWIQSAYPLVFSTSSVAPSSVAPSPDRPIAPSHSAWLKLFDSLVGDDLINRDRYAKLPIHTILTYLTTKYKENARKI